MIAKIKDGTYEEFAEKKFAELEKEQQEQIKAAAAEAQANDEKLAQALSASSQSGEEVDYLSDEALGLA